MTLYGTPVHRRVESTASPLVNTGPIPVKKVKDPTMPKGKTKVETQGVPPQATSVERKVYAPNGKLLVRRRVALVLPLHADGAPRRHQAEAEGEAEAATGAHHPVAPRAYDSAVAIASANHSGTRFGRKVTASTVAWRVQPSASSSPSRSIAYS